MYPRDIKCIVCDTELDGYAHNGLCRACTLPYNNVFCTVCGAPVLAQNAVCDRCKQTRFPFAAARSSFAYRDEAATLVHRLKFREMRFLAAVMAEFMADIYYKTDWNPDVVTFVPMHKRDKGMRGYNQSQLLAKEIGARIRKPARELLTKTVRGKHMVGLSYDERKNAVRDTFAPSAEADGAKGKTVLLIDDVLTTGATAAECTRMLLRAGVQKVYVLTFASVEYKQTQKQDHKDKKNGKRNKMRAKRI